MVMKIFNNTKGTFLNKNMKYLGSKERIHHKIIPHLVSGEPEVLYDLFCGGLNLSIHINKSRINGLFSKPIEIHANDINQYLIAMWKALQYGRSFPHSITKKEYDIARKLFKRGRATNRMDKALIGWIGGVSSFRGKFFGGYQKGKRHPKSPNTYTQESILNIQKQIPYLKNFIFYAMEYYEVPLKKGAVLYCDIPYKDSTEYEVAVKFDYDKFYQWCKDKKSEGHRVFISEYNMPPEFTVVWEGVLQNALSTKNTYLPVERLYTI
jgi:DNA adenine methylase